MAVIRFTGAVVLRRPRTNVVSPTTTDIGSATIIGAAIRCQRHGIRGPRRRWLTVKLRQLAAEGDPTAKLVLDHLTRKPGSPTNG
ncbi:hypothetical protein [uncultured Aureimonas sp.]|uniref:hypothetical protein n=1 Tax=uncultured Aureimonas sp. TaxID=1604662 RepID=UPI0025F6BF87|nr:hypothetical protein [uncultured Aureimonas sp.]